MSDEWESGEFCTDDDGFVTVPHSLGVKPVVRVRLWTGQRVAKFHEITADSFTYRVYAADRKTVVPGPHSVQWMVQP